MQARDEHLRQIGEIYGIWGAIVDPPERRLKRLGFVALVLFSAHIARTGTPTARGGVALVLLVVGVALVVHGSWKGRRLRSPLAQLVVILAPAGKVTQDKGGRALALVAQTRRDPSAGSPLFAWLHLQRIIASADRSTISESAMRRARRMRYLGHALLLLCGVAIALGPFEILEGLDVLFARNGTAPIALEWLEEGSIVGRPPEYLRQQDTPVDERHPGPLPEGSTVILRGVPTHPGRPLIVRDGAEETPLVEDGAGGVVARMTMSRDVHLQVAARFGAILIPTRRYIDIPCNRDAAPQVNVEGAPRTVNLVQEPEIDLIYDVVDDHGLREVDLVLRSGVQEERRVLSQFDGTVQKDRGGHRLLATDPFFKRTYAPAQVTIEARDNNPLRAPDWGKSEAITVVVPDVGEPEALRYRGLARGRDALVDLAAFRIDAEIPPGEALRQVHLHREKEESARAFDALREGIFGSYAGLRIPRRIAGLVLGQLRGMEATGEKERRSLSRMTHLKATDGVIDGALALNSALGRIAANDAAAVAKRLADVAEDAAQGADQARRVADLNKGKARFDGALLVVTAAEAHLSLLGELGRDLGEIVRNDLKRARRAASEGDFFHAGLAVRDLAARLRHPSPSFGGGKRGGVEAGGPPSPTEGDSTGEEGSEDGARDVAREQQEIDDIARDHAAQLAGVERALGSPPPPPPQGDVPPRADARRAKDLQGFSGQESSLADRVRSVAAEGKQGKGALPESTMDLLRTAERAMREAARALGQNQGDQGISQQQQAQRMLEMARSSGESGDGREGEGQSSDATGDSGIREGREGESARGKGGRDGHAPIPDAAGAQGAEEFRRRVVEGLAKSSDPRLREVVRRYAEGLLR